MARILILEPDEQLASSLSDAVERSGMRTIVQESSSGITDLLAVDPPALIILDLSIDDAQGVKACQTIRDTEGGELLPILMVGSGEEGIQSFGEALAEGGDYYFEKPVDLKQLISKIQTYVGVDRDSPTVITTPPAGSKERSPGSEILGRVDKIMDLGKSMTDPLLASPFDDDKDESNLDPEDLFDEDLPDKQGTETPLFDTPEQQEPTAPSGLLPPSELSEEQEPLPPPAPISIGPDPYQGTASTNKSSSEPFLKAPDSSPPPDEEGDEEGESKPAPVPDLEGEDKSSMEEDKEKDLRAWEQNLMDEAASESDLATAELEALAQRMRMEKEKKEHKLQEEQERKLKEEEERKRKEEEERKRKEEEERKRKEEEERKRKEEEERKRKEEEERLRKEEEERKRKEEEERKRKEEEERKRKEEEERLRKEEEERLRKEEEERLRKEEEERKLKEEQERKLKEEQGQNATGDEEAPEDTIAADAIWQEAIAASDSDEEEDSPPPLTMHGGDDLVELLEKEASLARVIASKAPEEDDSTDHIGTIPDLPPRPDEQEDRRASVDSTSIISRVRARAEKFNREDTVDIKPAFSPKSGRQQEAEATEENTEEQFLDESKQRPAPAPRRVPVRKPRFHTVNRTETEKSISIEPPSATEPDAFSRPPAEPGGADFFGFDEPPALMPPQPEHSDLSEESTPRLLWRLFGQQVSGSVVFNSGSDNKQLFLEHGVPIGIKSSQTADQLEELLFREGLIDRQAYAEARVKGISQPRALAAHLVEREMLRPEELFPLVRRHLEYCILGLFEWQAGTADFEPELAPDSEKVRLAKPMSALLVEGIRSKFLLSRMMDELGGPSSLLAAVPKEDRDSVAPTPQNLALTKTEQEVLRLVDGMRPLEEIVFISGQEVTTVYRVLLAASILGIVKVVVRGIITSGQEQQEALSRDLEIRRRRLEAKFEQINSSTYFDILGVKQDASPYEIKKAHDRLAREFHSLHFKHPSLAGLSTKLDLVQRTLSEALEVLSDELLREGYKQALKE